MAAAGVPAAEAARAVDIVVDTVDISRYLPGVSVDVYLLVPLAPGGHPARLHAEALHIVGVVLHTVHLAASCRRVSIVDIMRR